VIRIRILLLVIVGILAYQESAFGDSYNWLSTYDSSAAIINQIKTPSGFSRIKVEIDGFAEWLRHLPVRQNQDTIFRYDGIPYQGHNANFAIVDIDIGNTDLLQCADIIMRLRAEFLYSNKMYDSISFTFTNGDTARYLRWREGFRPRVNDNRVEWIKAVSFDSSYKSFREYLHSVFMYAGTYSLSIELNTVKNVDSLQIGDSFILGGFPGHAVMVADICEDSLSGQKLFMLIQGFTPAQDIHIIKNDERSDSLPWFEMNAGDTLKILYWEFTEEHLRRF
jgi:hypothetical protein